MKKKVESQILLSNHLLVTYYFHLLLLITSKLKFILSLTHPPSQKQKKN